MKDTRLLLLVFFVLIFFNASAVFAVISVPYVESLSYIFRIVLYLLLISKIHRINFASAIRNSYIYKFSLYVPPALILITIISVLSDTNANQIISRIFSTFFLLADNLFFLYLGYTYTKREDNKVDDIYVIWYFSVFSIILMTGITVFVKVVFGNLESLWNVAREGDAVIDKFLGVYKNANPYKFAVLAAFLFLRKSKYNIVLAVLCIVNILIAGKRGPLLGVVVSSFVIFLISDYNKRRYFKYLISFIVLFIVYYLVIDNSIVETLLYRMDISQHSARESNASFYMSGRDNIWEVMINGIIESNPLSLFFGHGTLGTFNLLTAHNGPGNAHNTWLEVCYNFGLIGLWIYIVYFAKIFGYCKRMRSFNYEHTSVFVFVFVFSLLSTFYTVTYIGGFGAPGYANIVISYLYGRYLYQYSTSKSIH